MQILPTTRELKPFPVQEECVKRGGLLSPLHLCRSSLILFDATS